MRYYNRDGSAFEGTVHEWARQFEIANRRVGLTVVSDGANPGRQYRVSTMFLGIDHNYSGGAPVLFETMVFAEGDDVDSNLDEEQDRYTTEAEAVAGHVRWVATVAAYMSTPVVAEVESSGG
jgi:hypothetical protein